MDNKGGSTLLTIFGVLFIIAGVIVAFFTVTGFMNHLMPSEIVSASYGYGIGSVIAIILIVIGGVILRSSR